MTKSLKVEHTDRSDEGTLADVALLLAGHDMSDPTVRQLGEDIVNGTIDVEDAVAQIRRSYLK